MFGKYNSLWISMASKKQLRKAIDEVYEEMCKYEMSSSKYNRLSRLHDKLVTAWSTNPKGNLPRHQHGWYLREDDDE